MASEHDALLPHAKTQAEIDIEKLFDEGDIGGPPMPTWQKWLIASVFITISIGVCA
jgi:hypothetical protein